MVHSMVMHHGTHRLCFIRPFMLPRLRAGLKRLPLLLERQRCNEAMDMLLIPVVIDNKAFEVGFKRKWQFNNIRQCCVYRKVSRNAAQ